MIKQFLALITVLFISANFVFAENSSRTAFSHDIVQTLPNPGTPLTITTRYVGSPRVDLPLKLLFVADGKAFTVIMDGGYDSNGEPLYSVTLPTPLAQLSYSFIIVKENGEAVVSPRYEITRSCIPIISSNILEQKAEDSSDSKNELIKLAQETKTLEQELVMYQSIIKILEGLKVDIMGGK